MRTPSLTVLSLHPSLQTTSLQIIYVSQIIVIDFRCCPMIVCQALCSIKQSVTLTMAQVPIQWGDLATNLTRMAMHCGSPTPFLTPMAIGKVSLTGIVSLTATGTPGTSIILATDIL